MKKKSLNQGNKPMEFVKNKTNRNHTLDGYKLENGKLVKDKTKSVAGYLKPVDDTSGMKQYGENLYSKMKKGGLVLKKKQVDPAIASVFKNGGKLTK